MNSPVSRATLESMFVEAGVDIGNYPPVLPDEQYALIDEDWFVEVAIPRLRDKCIKDVGWYEPEAGDCDDYTRCAATELKRLHRKTPIGTGVGQRAPKCSCASGAFWYKPAGSKSTHWIVWWSSRDKETLKPKLNFYEPQPTAAGITTLTRKEIESCSLVDGS